MEIKRNDKCRLCGGDLVTVLDYGLMPLANALREKESDENEMFEQVLMFCESCYLGQLSIVVNPEILFKDYVYHSSVSPVFIEHCERLAEEIPRKLETVVIDIAGNDGALAREVCKWNSEAKVFVIDPAQNEEEEKWVKIKKFWNHKTASDFIEEHGKADVITAQNVVGHVDDIIGFFNAVHLTLKEDGIFIVEIPSFVELLKSAAFETVYHEHVSYWTITAMNKIAKLTGFRLVQTKEMNIHCGSFRFYLKRGIQTEEKDLYEEEFFSSSAIEKFKKVCSDRIEILYNLSKNIPMDGVISVSASAKSSVILNMVNFPIEYAVDDTPAKQGKLIPGTKAEIKPFTGENVRGARIALILSRNITVPLINNLKAMGFSGVIISL